MAETTADNKKEAVDAPHSGKDEDFFDRLAALPMRSVLAIFVAIFAVVFQVTYKVSNAISGGRIGGILDAPTHDHLPDAAEELEFHPFAKPKLEVGEVEKLRWEEDGAIVQDYAARVGLPPKLVPTLKLYAMEMGIWDVMTTKLYDDPIVDHEGIEFYKFQSPYHKASEPEQMRNLTWNVERPGEKWVNIDMHWFNTADEAAHEDVLRALARGGFDEVIKGIANEFGLDSVIVDSFGFLAMTHCDNGYLHADLENVDGRAFAVQLGLHRPEGAGPELIIQTDDEMYKGEIYYGGQHGFVFGDGTRHGTRECDHRSSGETRISVTIWLVDYNEANFDKLAADVTAVFPPNGGKSEGKGWIRAQRGRHWWRDDPTVSLVNDEGRASLEFSDSKENCGEADCTDYEERDKCLRTCKIFIDDAEYKPGYLRREVLGY